MPATDLAALDLAVPSGAERWQELLQTAIRTTGELFAYLELSKTQVTALAPASSDFPLLVPRGFAARIRKREPDDPLLRQVLPVELEHRRVPGFDADPLRELAATRTGLIRKYAGRALLIATAACPVHCRYCFRRHFPYATQTAARNDWAALEDLERTREISEVILSGGDPLSLSNGRLGTLIERLDSLEHVTTLRIHSRFPVVLPERIDADLLALLARSRLTKVLVIHCNHAQEIDSSVDAAFAALQTAGVTLLNQSVLLRGINDDAAVLCALSRRLLEAGALPYYLHELDPVAGAAHFAVPRATALALLEALRRELPGYLVPRLVREIPGTPSKTIIA